jgi:hypothetical protein
MTFTNDRPKRTAKIPAGIIFCALASILCGCSRCIDEPLQVMNDPADKLRATVLVRRCNQSGEVSTVVHWKRLKREPYVPLFAPKLPDGDVFVCRGQHATTIRWEEQAPHGSCPLLIVATACNPNPQNPEVVFEALAEDRCRVKFEFIRQATEKAPRMNRKRKE